VIVPFCAKTGFGRLAPEGEEAGAAAAAGGAAAALEVLSAVNLSNAL